MRTSPAITMWQALRWPLLAAIATRAVAAWVALSFHSRDDYFHVLAPALAWLHDPVFDWEHSDLAGAGIRSHLLPRLVYWLLRGMLAVGVQSPDAQLRGLYLAMGLYSLTLVVAMYQAGLQCFGPVTARRAALCAALFFPFPYAGTRLLIEALAMPPLVAGLTYLARPQRRDAFLGGALLGLAMVWRFQVAAVMPGVLWAMWRARKQGGHAATPWARVGWAAAGLATVLGASGAYDWVTTGAFLGPMWNNFIFNVNMPAHQSRSAPWGYAGFWALLTLPPLVFWLAGPALRAARSALFISLPWASFVILHSAITHKEDRFMLPVVPLFALVMCQAWTLRDFGPHPKPDSGWQQTWPTARACGAIMLALGLFIAATGQSQANLRDAMLYLRQDHQVQGVVSLGPELQTWFLGRPEVKTRRSRVPDENWLQQALIEMHGEGVTPNRFISYSADKNLVEVFLRVNGYACAPPVEIEGWWLDRLLARLNPHRNQRRGPVLIHRCATPDVAAG